MSLEEIKLMKQSKFKNNLDDKIAVVAIKNLKQKQGSEGKEIQFSELQSIYCHGLAYYWQTRDKYFLLETKWSGLKIIFQVLNKHVCAVK